MQRNMLAELQLPKLEFNGQKDVASKNLATLLYLQQKKNVKNSATKSVRCKVQTPSMVSDFAGTFPEANQHINKINKKFVFTKHLQSINNSFKNANGAVNLNSRDGSQLPKTTLTPVKAPKADESGSKSKNKIILNDVAKFKSIRNSNFSIKISPVNKSIKSTETKSRNVVVINKDSKKKVQIQLKAPIKASKSSQQGKSLQVHQTAKFIKVNPPVKSLQIHQPVKSVQVNQPVKSLPGHHHHIKVRQPVKTLQVHQPVKPLQGHQQVKTLQIHQPVKTLQLHQPVKSVKIHQPVKALQRHQPVKSMQLHTSGNVFTSPQNASSLCFEKAKPVTEDFAKDYDFTLEEEAKPYCVISEVIGNADAAFSGALDTEETEENEEELVGLEADGQTSFEGSQDETNGGVKSGSSFQDDEPLVLEKGAEREKAKTAHCDVQINKEIGRGKISGAEATSCENKNTDSGTVVVKKEPEDLETQATSCSEGVSGEKSDDDLSNSYPVGENLANESESEMGVENESDSEMYSRNDSGDESSHPDTSNPSESTLITPKKTNDITKIKGWRRKQFLVEKPTTVEFYRIGKGSKQKKIKMNGEEEERGEGEEEDNMENPFTCDSLDEFLDGEVDLKIGYEIPHLYAELGIKLTSDDVLSKPKFSEKDYKEVEKKYCVPVPVKKKANPGNVEEGRFRAVKRATEGVTKPYKFMRTERRPDLKRSKETAKLNEKRCSRSSESGLGEDDVEECESGSEESKESPGKENFRLENKLLGLVVYPGPYQPVHPVVRLHLDKMRSQNTKIDKNWANFAVSAVPGSSTRCNRMILPARCCFKVKKNSNVAKNKKVKLAVANDAVADGAAADKLVANDAVAEKSTAIDTVTDGVVADDAAAGKSAVSDAVADDAVANAPVADDAVANNAPVADDAVANAPVADDAAANAPVPADAVANAPVADDAVANASVADDAVANVSVANDSVANDTVADDVITIDTTSDDDTVVDDKTGDNTRADNTVAPEQEIRTEAARDIFSEKQGPVKSKKSILAKNGSEKIKLKECCVVIDKMDFVESPSPWCMEHLTYDCEPCGLLRTNFHNFKGLTREEKTSTTGRSARLRTGEVAVLPKASFSGEIATLLSKKLRNLEFNRNSIVSIDHLKTLVPDNIEFIKLNFVQESYHSSYIKIWYMKETTPDSRSRAFLTFSESPPMPYAINLKPSIMPMKNLPKIISDIVSRKKTFSPNEYAILHCNGEVWELHGSLNIVFGKSDKNVEQVFATLHLPELDDLKKTTGKILKVKAVKWWILDLTQEFRLIEIKFGNVTSILSRKKMLELTVNDSLGFVPLRKLSKGRIVGVYINKTLLPFVLVGPYYLFESHNMTLRSESSVLPFMYFVKKNLCKATPLKYFINSVIKDVEENNKVLDGLWFYDKMCVDNTSYIEVSTRCLGTTVQRNFPNIDIEHGYSLNSLTTSLPPGVTAEFIRRRDGVEELKKICVYLYFDIFELGYLEGELQQDNSITIWHPLDRNTRVKSHRMGDWFVRTIRRRMEFIPKDIEVKWFVTRHIEDLRGRQPFNKFLLGGAHVLTKGGLFYLLEMSESRIEKLGLEKHDVAKAISENQVIQMVLQMRNLAFVITGKSEKLPPVPILLNMALEHIKSLEAVGESLLREKRKLTDQKLALTSTFLKTLNSYRMVETEKFDMVENIEHFFLKDDGDLDDDFKDILKQTKLGLKYYKRNLKYYRFIEKVRNESDKKGQNLKQNEIREEDRREIRFTPRLNTALGSPSESLIKILIDKSTTPESKPRETPENRFSYGGQSAMPHAPSPVLQQKTLGGTDPVSLRKKNFFEETNPTGNPTDENLMCNEEIVWESSEDNLQRCNGFLKIDSPELPDNIRLHWRAV